MLLSKAIRTEFARPAKCSVFELRNATNAAAAVADREVKFEQQKLILERHNAESFGGLIEAQMWTEKLKLIDLVSTITKKDA